jgi:hypothetical protein
VIETDELPLVRRCSARERGSDDNNDIAYTDRNTDTERETESIGREM